MYLDSADGPAARLAEPRAPRPRYPRRCLWASHAIPLDIAHPHAAHPHPVFAIFHPIRAGFISQGCWRINAESRDKALILSPLYRVSLVRTFSVECFLECAERVEFDKILPVRHVPTVPSDEQGHVLDSLDPHVPFPGPIEPIGILTEYQCRIKQPDLRKDRPSIYPRADVISKELLRTADVLVVVRLRVFAHQLAVAMDHLNLGITQ